MKRKKMDTPTINSILMLPNNLPPAPPGSSPVIKNAVGMLQSDIFIKEYIYIKEKQFDLVREATKKKSKKNSQQV